LRKQTKTRSGERKLVLTWSAVAVLRRRFITGARLDQPVSQTPGGFLDPKNVRRELQEARGAGELSWVTSHTFGKTAATMLDEAAPSARMIADQLRPRPAVHDPGRLPRALDNALREDPERVVYTDPQAAAVGADSAAFSATVMLKGRRQDRHLHTQLRLQQRAPDPAQRRSPTHGCLRTRTRGR